jgi:hypothetical protein
LDPRLSGPREKRPFTLSLESDGLVLGDEGETPQGKELDQDYYGAVANL